MEVAQGTNKDALVAQQVHTEGASIGDNINASSTQSADAARVGKRLVLQRKVSIQYNGVKGLARLTQDELS